VAQGKRGHSSFSAGLQDNRDRAKSVLEKGRWSRESLPAFARLVFQTGIVKDNLVGETDWEKRIIVLPDS
jgi:hypothetical protein